MLREAGEAATSACVGRLLGDLQMLAIGAIRGLSVSAGVALFGPEDEDPVSLFESAGRALADAQAAGGGRAAIASADGEGLGVGAELHRRDALEALEIALLERDRYTGEHYRARMSHADAFRELRRCAGAQFDPSVTTALVAHFYHERSGRPLLRAV